MSTQTAEHGEREALFAELDALEAGAHDGGLGDMLRAGLIELIEQRLDVCLAVADENPRTDQTHAEANHG